MKYEICRHDDYVPTYYEQYTVYGQDLLFKETKVKPLCKEHKMEETFLPSRGQYKKCDVCGYYETTHGGSYF